MTKLLQSLLFELNIQLFLNAFHCCSSVSQDRIQIENGALTISSVNLSDAGMYQCVAENKHGIIYFGAELVVLGKRASCTSSFPIILRLCSLCRSIPANTKHFYISKHCFLVAVGERCSTMFKIVLETTTKIK